jgi:hypothetical protein
MMVGGGAGRQGATGRDEEEEQNYTAEHYLMKTL